VASVTDVRGAIGFSSFAVLLYYAIANVAAWTLEGPWHRRLIPAAGVTGCLLLAFTLPRESVLAGLLVVAVGATLYRFSARPLSGTGRPRRR
jgi:APA family basic amino acid/polyamine antiporter